MADFRAGAVRDEPARIDAGRRAAGPSIPFSETLVYNGTRR